MRSLEQIAEDSLSNPSSHNLEAERELNSQRGRNSGNSNNVSEDSSKNGLR